MRIELVAPRPDGRTAARKPDRRSRAVHEFRLPPGHRVRADRAVERPRDDQARVQDRGKGGGGSDADAYGRNVKVPGPIVRRAARGAVSGVPYGYTTPGDAQLQYRNRKRTVVPWETVSARAREVRRPRSPFGPRSSEEVLSGELVTSAELSRSLTEISEGEGSPYGDTVYRFEY
ncbi:hypothetical protein [Methanopyrus sp.]